MSIPLSDLFLIQTRIVNAVSPKFKRYLYSKINWENRLIALIGSRGTGKTTLLLQHYNEVYNDPEKCLYISADNPLVIQNGIYKTVEEYFKYYGECVIIDEVHKQVNWSIEIKALYDSYPGKKIIISGSSIMKVMNEKGDLSRRLIIYKLPLLSFREYLDFKYGIKHQSVTFDSLLSNHVSIAHNIVKKHSTILGDFNDFREFGNYPFFMDHTKSEYYTLFENILDKIIYEDISKIQSLKEQTTFKLKKLIGYLALSKIPLFNISSLTNEIEVSKDTLYLFFELLKRSEIISVIRTEDASLRRMKNSKILFKSTNTYYALSENWWKHDPDPGNIREAFFADQVGSQEILYTSRIVDFTVKTKNISYEIEVGGKNKTKKQLQGVPNGYIFKDGIEIGYGNVIPLYLVGFLY
ncbi:MAG: ATP-binding protein [Spirochaetales bacterium]|nr:ATP-binding protein [Spirochaetales bacterium]